MENEMVFDKTLNLKTNELKQLKNSLDDFINSQEPVFKIDAVQSFLQVINDFKENNQNTNVTALYESALYKYGTILDELNLNKDQNKNQIFLVNQFMENYFEKAGYDINKIYNK